MTITGVLSAASPMLMQCPGKATLSIWPAALKTQSWDFDPLQGLTIVAALFPFGPSRHQLPNRLFNWTGSAALATPALSNATPNTVPTTTRGGRVPPINRDSCISASPLVLIHPHSPQAAQATTRLEPVCRRTSTEYDALVRRVRLSQLIDVTA